MADNTPNEHLARWLSRVFHPYIMLVLTLLLSIYLQTGQLWEAVLWAAVCAAAFLLPFAIFILVMVYTGRYSDLDVSIREQRYGLYPVADAGLLLLVVVFALGDAPPIGRASVYAAASSVVVGAVLNRFSKVSVHAMVAAGGAVVLFYLSSLAGLALTVPAALVGWSRVRLKRHTWSQVIAGWGTAIVCVAAVFYLWFYARVECCFRLGSML